MLTFNYEKFSIKLNDEDIKKCAHEGECYDDCKEVMKKDYVSKQLNAIPLSELAHELDLYGVDYDDGDDIDYLRLLIIWNSACYLKEELCGSLYN